VSKLYKFVILPWRGKLLYSNAAFWLLAVKAGLYLLPFERLRGWLVRLGEPVNRALDPASKFPDSEEIREITEAVSRLGRFLAPLRISCLPQALVGDLLLRRKGFDVQLKIGVLKSFGDQLVAHAWLECQGRVILGDLHDLDQFISFSALAVSRRSVLC
jgi:hypothetical protein